jgi:hypothetical protein
VSATLGTEVYQTTGAFARTRVHDCMIVQESLNKTAGGSSSIGWRDKNDMHGTSTSMHGFPMRDYYLAGAE